jgi:hypothetical protein
MNLYNNIFNVLWKHLEKIEMLLKSMEYPKAFFKQCNQCLLLLNSNDVKMTFLLETFYVHLYIII